ncbi:MAG: (2Fe-2S) ferredoxin domain-containing protein [Clostridia bacterium]|nr:(2Fe-2S) ferredoxin domain-containing protein [Clostridia bacterium]
MKSLAELAEIREKNRSKVILPDGSKNLRVVVGMATCGIAAGATPVLNTLVEGVKAEGIADKVAVLQTGCVGVCQYEPVVEVYEAGKDRVTYVRMTAEKAERVLKEHLVGGKVVEEYLITTAQKA